MNNILDWHCIFCDNSRIQKIIPELKKLGLEIVYLTKENKRAARSRECALTGQRFIIKQMPLFQGYLFFRGHYCVVRPIMSIKGIKRIITIGENARPIPNKIIQGYLIAQAKGDYSLAKDLQIKIQENLKRLGEKFTIEGGAFDGIEIEAKKVNSKTGELEGEIEILGKNISIPIET